MAKGAVLRVAELPVTADESVGAAPLRLDIGCGKTKMDGWVGIDVLEFGQAILSDLRKPQWELKWSTDSNDYYSKFRDSFTLHQRGMEGEVVAGKFDYCRFKDGSVSEVRSSHFVEHLTGTERIAFFNELHRVMKVGATAQIVTPNWSHACAYGDPTHQWPPMSQWYPLYLNKVWRDANAPHAPYTCDFDHVVAGSWDQAIEGRNAEHKQFAMNSYTNAWRDLIVTITKK